MKRSAAWSSSLVVTPGRILPASRFIVRTRTAPAAAIRSISSWDFLMIMAYNASASDVLLQTQRGDHRADMAVDVGGLTRAVDATHEPELVVVVDQRLGLVVIDAQPVLDHLGLVVVA